MKNINVVNLRDKGQDYFYNVSHSTWDELHKDVDLVVKSIVGESSKHDGNMGIDSNGIYFGFEEIIERKTKGTGRILSFKTKGLITLREINSHIDMMNLNEELMDNQSIDRKVCKV
jgi:hypothetical protein